MPGQRNRAAGIAGAAAARNNRQSEFDAGAHDLKDFFFRIRIDDNEGVFHPPVGGVGDVGDAGQPVELHIVAACGAREPCHRAATQCQRVLEFGFETVDRSTRSLQQFRHPLVRTVTPCVDAVETVAHAFHQRRTPFAIAEQIVLDVRIALDDPHVAQHFVKHFCRTSGAALRAQFVEQLPAFGAK